MLYSARVKTVLSADTLVLVPVNAQSGAKERQLSLAYISAPKISQNEPYAFESRELLRKLLVNKVIKFEVLYTLSGFNGQKREFGDVKTPIFDSLIKYLLEKGAAKVKDYNDPEDPDFFSELQRVQLKAQDAKAGLWSGKKAVTVGTDLPVKDKTLKAIVEKVISGDRFLLRFLVDGKHHVVTPVLVAGVKCPKSGPEAEPFGDQARLFVEQRLLLQDVEAKVVGESSTGVLVCEITHPKGSIAELLLKQGLARVVDWQSQFLGASAMSVLRANERVAKVAQLGIWTSVAVEKNNSTDITSPGAVWTANVIKVISADTLVLLHDEVEHTVQLASVRAPLMSDAESAPFVPFAKEFLRKKVIGKSVEVTVTGKRPKTEKFEERLVVMIQLGSHDLGETLVKHGWCSVSKFKGEDSATNWDFLLESEQEATKKKLGIHGKIPATQRVVDASDTAARAKTFLTQFRSRKRFPAVVDYVSSGTRYRLLLPKDNVKLVLVLGGLSAKSGSAATATEFAAKKTLQRDVEVEVWTTDRTGGFIGNLYLPGAEKPFQLELLSQGLYEVHDFSLDSTGYADEFVEAQELAQKLKFGMWKNYEAETAKTPAKPQVLAQKKYYDVEVNDISNEGLVSFQFVTAESESFVQFMKLFHEFHSLQPISATAVATTSKSYPKVLKSPKKGDLCSVQFSSNGKYYRGRIVAYDRNTRKYRVQHIDFGNFDEVSAQAFRELPAQFGIDKMPAQGHVAKLSLIRLPPAVPTDYRAEAIDLLYDLVVGRKVIAREDVSRPEPGVEMLFTLYEPEKVANDPKASVNRELVKEGLGLTTKDDQGDKEEWSVLKKLEQDARKRRAGCWEFGDVGMDDEE